MPGVADRRVAAALALGGADHVPQADAARPQAREPGGIVAAVQVLADYRPDQPPELVGRKGVIAGSASERSPGRLPRMNNRVDGSAIGGSPDLTLNK